MKTYFLVPIFLMACLPGFTQVNLERQVLGSTGGYSTAGNVQLSATVGEAVSTTLISGTLILTQGYQQPDRNYWADAIEDLLEIVVSYEVFPNPTSDLLTVRFESQTPVSLRLHISDLSGKQLAGFSRQIDGIGQHETNFSMASLAEGVYLLSFIDANGQLLHTQKIQKK